MDELEAETEEASRRMEAARIRRVQLMAAEAEEEALAVRRTQEALGESDKISMVFWFG